MLICYLNTIFPQKCIGVTLGFKIILKHRTRETFMINNVHCKAKIFVTIIAITPSMIMATLNCVDVFLDFRI